MSCIYMCTCNNVYVHLPCIKKRDKKITGDSTIPTAPQYVAYTLNLTTPSSLSSSLTSTPSSPFSSSSSSSPDCFDDRFNSLDCNN